MEFKTIKQLEKEMSKLVIPRDTNRHIEIRAEIKQTKAIKKMIEELEEDEIFMGFELKTALYEIKSKIEGEEVRNMKASSSGGKE